MRGIKMKTEWVFFILGTISYLAILWLLPLETKMDSIVFALFLLMYLLLVSSANVLHNKYNEAIKR
jgi:hypothetical protein